MTTDILKFISHQHKAAVTVSDDCNNGSIGRHSGLNGDCNIEISQILNHNERESNSQLSTFVLVLAVVEKFIKMTCEK